MSEKKLIPGRKYFPISKTPKSFQGLYNSNELKAALEKRQPFLYYREHDGTNHVFTATPNGKGGDYFKASDMVLLHEVGDKVKILSSSTNLTGNSRNPRNTIGKVTSVDLDVLYSELQSAVANKSATVRNRDRYIYQVKWPKGENSYRVVSDLYASTSTKSKTAKSKATTYQVSEEFLLAGYKAASSKLRAKLEKQFPHLVEPELFSFGDSFTMKHEYNNSPMMIAHGLAPEDLEDKAFVVSDRFELKTREHRGKTLYYFIKKS